MSDSVAVEGASLRLVLQAPDAEGRFRGALLVELEPGWKTYWLDPGGLGLAPTLDFSGSRDARVERIRLPAPERLDEGGLVFNGYDAPVAIAFEGRGEAGAFVDLSLLLGLCRDICVPVSADLRQTLSARASFATTGLIERAFLALPEPDAVAADATIGERDLVVRGLPARDGDLFVAGVDGWSFGAPRIDGQETRVPILARGKERPKTLEGVVVGEGHDAAVRIDIPSPAP